MDLSRMSNGTTHTQSIGINCMVKIGERSIKQQLLDIYTVLLGTYGHQNWWPADEPFEVIIGAILTQNVSWNNVEKAIANLKGANLLTPNKMHEVPTNELSVLIKPTRYYNQKAHKIKSFLDFLFEKYSGDFREMKNQKIGRIREELLGIKGFGKETVDSILLYALDYPIFVIDAYTKRIFERYGFFPESSSYEECQSFFMSDLPRDISLYNDFHAQIVILGKMVCKKNPSCEKCPIKRVKNDLQCSYPSSI